MTYLFTYFTVMFPLSLCLSGLSAICPFSFLSTFQAFLLCLPSLPFTFRYQPIPLPHSNFVFSFYSSLLCFLFFMFSFHFLFISLLPSYLSFLSLLSLPLPIFHLYSFILSPSIRSSILLSGLRFLPPYSF